MKKVLIAAIHKAAMMQTVLIENEENKNFIGGVELNEPFIITESPKFNELVLPDEPPKSKFIDKPKNNWRR